MLDAKGSIVTEADDTRGLGKDRESSGRLRRTVTTWSRCPTCTTAAGSAFGYVLHGRAARPDFALTCDPDLINVGPGGRVPVFVRLTRRNGFDSAVSLGWRGPARGGVTASPLTIESAR